MGDSKQVVRPNRLHEPGAFLDVTNVDLRFITPVAFGTLVALEPPIFEEAEWI